jgi:hypothetical protein
MFERQKRDDLSNGSGQKISPVLNRFQDNGSEVRKLSTKVSKSDK